MGNMFKLKNGSILLSTEAPGGIYNASQLKKIASLCDGDSIIVKATEDQRLALLVNPAVAGKIAEELKGIGLGIRHYQDGLHQPVSCIGEMCEDHEQDALGSAMDISSEMEGLKLSSPLKIGLNGCAKCCVPCHTLDISIVGDSAGYRISLGGKNSQLPEMASFMAEGVPPAELPRLVKAVVEIYKTGAQEGESLQEFIERNGSSQFVQALAPWSQDAADTGDPLAVGVSTDMVMGEMPDDLSVDSPQDEDVGAASSAAELAEADLEGIPEDSMETFIESSTEPSIDEIAIHENGLDGEQGIDLDITAAPSQAHQDLSISAEQDSLDSSLDEIPVGEDSLEQLESVSASEVSEDISEVQVSVQEVELADDSLDAVVEDVAETMSASRSPAKPSEDPLAEDIISAGDALRTPDIQAVQQQALSAEDEARSEDLIEESITAGIDDAKELVEDDASEDLRSQSMELLESTAASLAQDDLEMPEPEMMDDEITVEQDMDAEDDEEFDVNQHLPLSEVVATSKPASRSISVQGSSHSNAWVFSGFDLDEQGWPVINWTNGASMTLTAEAVENGSIRVGQREITLRRVAGGIQVQFDGLKMFLPAPSPRTKSA